MPSVIPQKSHRAVGKETGKTSHIERFNNPMRQRISRQRSLNSIFLKKAREITLVLFGILFIIIMLAYRLELAITTYLPLASAQFV